MGTGTILAILALASHMATAAVHTSIVPIQKGIKRTRQLSETQDSTVPELFSEVIPHQYIIALRPESGDAATATALLLAEVQAALQRSATREAAAGDLLTGTDTYGSNGTSHIQLVKVIGNRSPDWQEQASEPTTVEASASINMAVLLLSTSALPFVQQSQLVSAVIPDLVVRAIPVQCVALANVTQGLSTTPTAQFRWPGCYTSSSSRVKLVWRGVACEGGSSIYWNQIRAVDSTTNAVLTNPLRRQCIWYPSVNRTSNLELFGACGVTPRFAPTLPTRICSTGGGGSGGGSGGGGTTPGMLPRVPVQIGESIPQGLLRVEAATSAGVANISAGLPLTVGIMDSGIDATHPDLNYVGGTSWVTVTPKTLPQDTDPAADAFGHGTHVSGTVGAKNNGQGLLGVAPGVGLYSLKILDGAGAGSLSNAIDAINWVTSSTGGRPRGIRVVNLSFAGFVDPNNTDYQNNLRILCAPFKAANDAGVATVAAAGNYASSIAGWLPAACPSVLAVTAVDSTSNAAAGWSNFLPLSAPTAEQAHVIAAPGTGINSTMSFSSSPSGYRELSGTSVACPHVSGIIAACLISGACTGSSTGSAMYAVIQAAAQERLAQAGKAAYGFRGDAAGSVNGRFYGYMAWAKY